MFKVGDYVVHPKFSDRNLYKIYEISGSITKVQLMPNGRKSYSFESDIRHATPQEIAAGHRIESSNDQAISDCSVSNLCKNDTQNSLPIKQENQDLGDDSPIENHISPLCEVKDHEAK